MQIEKKTTKQQGTQPRRGRSAPLAQVPLLAFLFSFSFEFLFDLNNQKRISTNVYPQRWRIDCVLWKEDNACCPQLGAPQTVVAVLAAGRGGGLPPPWTPARRPSARLKNNEMIKASDPKYALKIY